MVRSLQVLILSFLLVNHVVNGVGPLNCADCEYFMDQIYTYAHSDQEIRYQKDILVIQCEEGATSAQEEIGIFT